MARVRTERNALASVWLGRRMWHVLLVLAVLASTIACGGLSLTQDERTQALSMAQAAYATAKESGVDSSDGPCIAEQLEKLPNWSVDVAHNPRQDVDNDPANQCSAYRQRKTHHFVELDPNGNLIRTH